MKTKKLSKTFVCGHTTNSWAEPRRSVGLALLAAEAGHYVKFDMKKNRLMTRIIFILVVCFLAGLSPISAYSSEPSSERSQKQFNESKPNIHFTDFAKQEKFVSWLTEEGIPFKIEKLDNKANEYVTWDKENDAKVQEMLWNI